MRVRARVSFASTAHPFISFNPRCSALKFMREYSLRVKTPSPVWTFGFVLRVVVTPPKYTLFAKPSRRLSLRITPNSWTRTRPLNSRRSLSLTIALYLLLTRGGWSPRSSVVMVRVLAGRRGAFTLRHSYIRLLILPLKLPVKVYFHVYPSPASSCIIAFLWCHANVYDVEHNPCTEIS